MPVHSARKDSERLQRETSQGVLLEEGWWLPRGCGRHCPRHATAVGTEQGAEQEYVLQLAVSPAGTQTSGLYPLSPLFAQADWPLEGTRLPMEPPRMAGSTVRLCGARATCPELFLSTRKQHGCSASLLGTLCQCIYAVWSGRQPAG